MTGILRPLTPRDQALSDPKSALAIVHVPPAPLPPSGLGPLAVPLAAVPMISLPSLRPPYARKAHAQRLVKRRIKCHRLALYLEGLRACAGGSVGDRSGGRAACNIGGAKRAGSQVNSGTAYARAMQCPALTSRAAAGSGHVARAARETAR
eukprot:2170297-Rhodomonas_salina.1